MPKSVSVQTKKRLKSLTKLITPYKNSLKKQPKECLKQPKKAA